MTQTSQLADANSAALALLREAFTELRTARKLRHREAAAELGVSEGEALAAFVGEHVVRLGAQNADQFAALFEQMPLLGEVMVLTRNDAVVHEKTGTFGTMSRTGPVGLTVGPAIDLRIFYAKWASAFAVREVHDDGVRKSLQFFDAQGVAITKVYLRDASDHAAFDALVAQYAAPSQEAGLSVEAAQPRAPQRDDAQIDVAGFRAAWSAMNDTHEFFDVLRKFGVARLQALRLADKAYAEPIALDAIDALLNDAAGTQLPIMVFVGNPGMIQIHTGPVQTIRTMGPWLNVLDADFNLHLRTNLVAHAWVVRKPTSDGIVTSVELFDAAGENIAMLFGARKPGQPEREDWRAVVQRLARIERPESANEGVNA
ncbi:hemin-degrading factor [Paraburkholderia sp. Ac-20340]|uniref:hemin-degrading factor n=1 Tax=Paraburkholderia sp. Ac-20340 TaxID=2703888 RepID=UPI00197F7E3C|nr:ChuX/HutX family heme-like substrate-binding protein [Paraburkholderia sp. Ac-20340]MBN3858430.1 hemin-degrading factor [Paraburkholderia sp. Ac-20340]